MSPALDQASRSGPGRSTLPVNAIQAPRMRHALLLPIGDEGRLEQVTERLIRAVTSGVLGEGERLPSEAELAKALHVAPVTVREALGELRSRDLITTRRGRGGGSFVTAAADPILFARRHLVSVSRLALRDLGLHYAAIGAACAGLAAQRAQAEEIGPIRELIAQPPQGNRAWIRQLDEATLELAATSQSARLSREQMSLYAELSPLLSLLDSTETLTRRMTGLDRVLAAAEARDPELAASSFQAEVTADIGELATLRQVLSQD